LLVLIEHILAVFILLPWCLLQYKNRLFSLNAGEWISAIFSGVGGSALAMFFYSASFLYVNPSVAVLLQKLQPVFVVLIAYLILGERPLRKFYFWGFVALIAVVALSFPNLNFRDGEVSLSSKGIQYAISAAFIWAISTVTGKALLKRTPTIVASFWRFFFGMVALAIFFGLSSFSFDLFLPTHYSSQTIFSVLYLSLIPGLLAMLLYYQGLARTPASVVSFIELLYPIGAVILNTLILDTPLQGVQILAGAVLDFAVARISM
jgi:drug/metabolite transporter (DMT)-like permease